jgi:hypothetical protein
LESLDAVKAVVTTLEGRFTGKGGSAIDMVICSAGASAPPPPLPPSLPLWFSGSIAIGMVIGSAGAPASHPAWCVLVLALVLWGVEHVESRVFALLPTDPLLKRRHRHSLPYQGYVPVGNRTAADTGLEAGLVRVGCSAVCVLQLCGGGGAYLGQFNCHPPPPPLSLSPPPSLQSTSHSNPPHAMIYIRLGVDQW